MRGTWRQTGLRQENRLVCGVGKSSLVLPCLFRILVALIASVGRGPRPAGSTSERKTKNFFSLFRHRGHQVGDLVTMIWLASPEWAEERFARLTRNSPIPIRYGAHDGRAVGDKSTNVVGLTTREAIDRLGRNAPYFGQRVKRQTATGIT